MQTIKTEMMKMEFKVDTVKLPDGKYIVINSELNVGQLLNPSLFPSEERLGKEILRLALIGG